MFRQLIRRGLTLILSTILTLAPISTTAFAAQDWSKIPQVTVDVPGTNGLQITFTNVASLYLNYEYKLQQFSEEEGGGTLASRGMFFYVYDDATISFNKPVEILFKPDDYTYITEVINVGETLSASDLSRGNYLRLGQGENLALLDTTSDDKYDFSNGNDHFNIVFDMVSFLERDGVANECVQLSNIAAPSV